jgi:hypothetical protein
MRDKRQSGIALATTLLILALLSAMLVGFMLLVTTDQQLSGVNKDEGTTFYGAEAGMEKLTADLGTLFDDNYAPSGAQVNALTQTPPPIPGVQYVGSTGGSGYQIAFPTDGNGNPLPATRTILSGPYQGLVGLLTPYTLTVTARTLSGSEVKLQRSVQTVAIPVFQFGIFSQTDLSFFAGPNFNFGGRIHTNGNLWLAEGDGSTFTASDRVTAVGEVIRTNLSNGWLTSNSYNGTVNIDTAPSSFRALAKTEGSLVTTLGSAQNEPTWTNLSIGSYNGNLRNGRTGAKPLNLAIVTLGNGVSSPVDIIRRAVPNENNTNPGVLGERYYSQASVRILLSDNSGDISTLPCSDTSKSPVDLSTLAVPVASLPGWYTAGIPLAASGATSAAYSSGNGYWIANGKPIITGFIKIEVQTTYGSPCGIYKDVTQEVLNLGVAGRNPNPLTAPAPPALPGLPGSGTQLPVSGCAYASPNAVIRLERVRDNPSTAGAVGGCGVGGATVPTNPSDYWPNALFDPREGNSRDNAPAAPNSNRISLGGVMYFVELDVNNLARWLTGGIGASGPSALDVTNPTHDFVVYFSDRRGNHNGSATTTGTETGEYGFSDFVNPASANACPNATLDLGEDLDSDGILKTYGQAPILPGNLLTTAPALTLNPSCAVISPSTTWPGMYFTNTQDARENPPLFFRRALKLTNGSSVNLGTCIGGVPCGLSIVAENPVYVQGDYNAAGGSFSGAHLAASVMGDSVTLLSNKWNDVNSFISPYNIGGRNATTTWYRTGIVAGKDPSFPQPTGYGSPKDFGTDGGVHNFLRYIENWGGQTLNYRGSIVSFYFNRQGIGVYKCCATVYSPPTRGYNFDVEFLNPTLLPPRTPVFHDVNTTGFTQLIMPNQ